MMSQYILQIISSALNNSSNPDSRVSSLLMSAKRVAILRQDLENLWWINLEFCNSENSGFKSVDMEMMSKFPYEEYKRLSKLYVTLWLSERSIEIMDSDLRIQHSDNVFPPNVYDIESQLKSYENPFEFMVSTKGMHTLDVYYTEQQNAKSRIILQHMRSQYETMLNKIRARVENFLIKSEQQVINGNSLSQYFENNRKYVESKLSSLNGNYQDYFDALSNHILHGTQIDFQEALLDIRRILLAFANDIFPPNTYPITCSDGKKRVLTEDKYLNRIVQAIYSAAGKHTHTELLNGNLNDLVTRLEKINELSCKGVHTDIPEHEANQCIIQMYILLGDVLRILKL